jgi:hypothetical protein
METIINHLIVAFKYVIDAVDWVYLVMFMLTCYVIIKGFLPQVTSALMLSHTKLQEFKTPWYLKTRNVVLIVGIIYAIGFGLCKMFYGLPWHNPELNLPYGFVLFFSFIFGQFLNLYGIDKIVDAIIEGVKGLWKMTLNKFGRS